MLTSLLAALTVWMLINALWSIQNWRTHNGRIKFYRAMDLSAESTKQQAFALLRNARKAVSAAALEQEHKVCSECKRIVVRHSTEKDHHGNEVTTCANCLATQAKKVS